MGVLNCYIISNVLTMINAVFDNKRKNKRPVIFLTCEIFMLCCGYLRFSIMAFSKVVIIKHYDNGKPRSIGGRKVKGL